MENIWKKNLLATWIGCFLTGLSFSMAMPFMGRLVSDMVSTDKVTYYTGIVVSITAFSTALIAPFWGRLADKIGRKPLMIVASIGVTLTMGSLGLIHSIYILIFMRFLVGTVQGYVPNSTVMIATQVPSNQKSWALGLLSTGLLAGNLIGPTIGGLIGEYISIRSIFFVAGLNSLICYFITKFFVTETTETNEKKEDIEVKKVIKEVKNPLELVNLLLITFTLRLTNMSITPMIVSYVASLSSTHNKTLVTSGLIISLSSMSALITTPIIGRMGDRFGIRKILAVGMAGLVICIFFMGKVNNASELAFLYFFMGICTQSIVPSVNTLINANSPVKGESRVYSLNVVSQNIGQIIGPLFGAFIVVKYGHNMLFTLLAIFLLINWILLMVYMSRERKLLK